MTAETQFWADAVAHQVLATRTHCCVATGITPSGHIHIGNLREVATADAVVRALREQTAKVDFIYIADTFDPLRHVYPFLDEKIYSSHVGQPLSEIPAPDGSGQSYAEYFLQPFLQSLQALDIQVAVVRADQAYKSGLYTQNIIRALEQTNTIKDILHKVTGKQMEPHWSPFIPLCGQCGKLDGRVDGFDARAETVSYVCCCGHEGQASMAGGGKLTWRVDWPARWQIFSITVEPFGKDHASRGGSYDSGKLIAKEVFNYEAPTPVVYEWISLKGAGDMSSSKGNVISIAEMIDVVPPEVLKYMIFKATPSKTMLFDPGVPLLSILDEFDDPEARQRHARASDLARITGIQGTGVPFRHLITLAQIHRGNIDAAWLSLQHSGYPNVNRESLASRLQYAQAWLGKFGPEDMKFEVQSDLPAVAGELSIAQKQALQLMADRLQVDMTAQAIHELIYAVKDETSLSPQLLFEAIYLAILGKHKGPRAGFFLASLDMNFVKHRFVEAAQLI